jgi:hypothetical protein
MKIITKFIVNFWESRKNKRSYKINVVQDIGGFLTKGHWIGSIETNFLIDEDRPKLLQLLINFF